jgi:hypothetical protein
MNTYLVFFLDDFGLFGMYEATDPRPHDYTSSRELGHALYLASDPYSCIFEQLVDGSWQAVDPV